MSKNKSWTLEEDRALIKMRREGLSAKDCAVVLGRTCIAVRQHCVKKLGIKAERIKGYGQTLTQQQLNWLDMFFSSTPNPQICRRMGISENTLTRVAKQRGLQKSEEYLLEMRRSKYELAREVWAEKRKDIPKKPRKRYKSTSDQKKRYNLCYQLRLKGYIEEEWHRFYYTPETKRSTVCEHNALDMGIAINAYPYVRSHSEVFISAPATDKVRSDELDFSALAAFLGLDQAQAPKPKRQTFVPESSGAHAVSTRIVRDLSAYANTNSFTYDP